MARTVAPMPELNTAAAVETFDQAGMDTLTVVDMGDTVALSQVAEDGSLHNVILGHDQLESLVLFARKVLG